MDTSDLVRNDLLENYPESLDKVGQDIPQNDDAAESDEAMEADDSLDNQDAEDGDARAVPDDDTELSDDNTGTDTELDEGERIPVASEAEHQGVMSDDAESEEFMTKRKTFIETQVCTACISAR